jgi:hypothetical protein
MQNVKFHKVLVQLCDHQPASGSPGIENVNLTWSRGLPWLLSLLALAAWFSGHRVRLQIRRSRVRIPPWCQFLGVYTLQCCCHNLTCIVCTREKTRAGICSVVERSLKIVRKHCLWKIVLKNCARSPVRSCLPVQSWPSFPNWGGGWQ